ncbi:MAG: DNA helicase UvrD, partial [Herpetosiphon sp.]|nr:DNA helicase UvrD [Herpetosiphon sp.]
STTPSSASMWSNASVSRKSARPAATETQFNAGDKVKHSIFGDGMVVSSKLVDGDEEVTVAFPGKGVKKLLAAFAKLERL